MKKCSKELSRVSVGRVASGIKCIFMILFAVVPLISLLYPSVVSATPLLGSAQSFAVLGHAGVTNGHNASNKTTQIYGNVGVTPGSSITGFYPDGSVSGGAIHNNDGVAQLAMADATKAYNILADLPFTYNYSDIALGSAGYTTLTPGVYHFDSSALLTGALTLDFQGNPDADFIFQIGSTLTSASGSSVKVVNGNSQSGVYWQVGSSATLGTDTSFAGNILALASVGLNPRAEIMCGRAIALTGAVALTDNRISNNSTQGSGNDCSDFGSNGFSEFSGGSGTPGPAPVPEPSTMLLSGIGLAGLVIFLKRKQYANRKI